MKGRHFAEKVNNKSKKTRSIILSLVAAIELLLLITSMTFSWFEGLTSLEMFGENIKTAPQLFSHAMLGENKSESDTTYSDIIDLTKFFEAQRDVRLSPVSSADGKNFFAAYDGAAGANGTKYRKLSPEDVNANIIQFEFNLSSPDGPTDIYLSEIVPRVYINGTEYTNRYSYPFRFGFSDGETTHVLSTNNILNQSQGQCFVNQKAVGSLNSDSTANIVTGVVERTRRYSYYANHSTHINGPGANGTVQNGTKLEPLFHLNKNEKKTIRVSVWLEALDYECLNNTAYKPKVGSDISFGLKLCSSWSIYRSISVYDYTADKNITDNYKQQDTALYVRNMDGNSDPNKRSLYELTYDTDSDMWTGNIPIGLENCEFLLRPMDDPKNSAYNNYPTWQAENRGNSTLLTLLGTSTCVWNLEPGDLIKIDFRDYTGNGWIVNDDDKGNDIDIAVKIIYDGRILEYNMSDKPTKDDNQKNSWSCWIPNKVDDVIFNKCGYNTSNVYTNLHTWYASDRGEDYIYYATDPDLGGSIGDNTSYILYLSIKPEFANKFYLDGKSPAISFTSSVNHTYVDNVSNIRQNLDRTQYQPKLDEWPNGTGTLSKIDGKDNLYYIAFAEKPENGKNITIWNRNDISGYNVVDKNTSFGITQINTTNDTIYLNSVTELEHKSADNNYYLKLAWNNDGTGAVGGTTGDLESGVWGEMPISYPEGTYNTYFVPMNSTSSVTAEYKYQGKDYSVSMKKGDDGIWYTNYIPDSTDNGYLTFTDSNGMKWRSSTSDKFKRSNNYNYFYPYKPTPDTEGSIQGAGNFCHKLEGNTVNFVHYESKDNIAMYVRFTYKITDSNTTNNMYVPLTKGSDGLTWSTSCLPSNITSFRFYELTIGTDSTRYWNTTSGRNTAMESTYYATGKSAGKWSNNTIYLVTDSNLWAKDSAWFNIYATGGTVTTNVMFKPVSGSTTKYYAQIPSGTTTVRFRRINPSQDMSNWNSGIWNQTGDISIPSGNDTFTITSWTNGKWGKSLYLSAAKSGWDADGAWFAAYFFKGDSTGVWVKMIDTDYDGIYEVISPEPIATYPSVIFARMDTNNTALSWNSVWNQSGDLTIPTSSNNLFTPSSFDKPTTTWSVKETAND